MKAHVFAIGIACLALGAHAAPDTKPTMGEIIVQMTTKISLDAKGNQTGDTLRDVRVWMNDGKGTHWGDMPGEEFTLQTAEDYERINPKLARTRPEGSKPDFTPRFGPKIAKGMLGTKMVEGVQVAGEWREFAAPNGGTNRMELWWRVDMGKIRPQTIVIKTSTRIEKIDYWYTMTERLHPEMFKMTP